MSLPRRTRRPPSSGERQRRDPRAERETPAAGIPVEPVTRTRRDPRAERGPAAPAGENPRIDRSRPLRFVEETTAPEQPPITAATTGSTIVIEDPACWILAIPDLNDGRLSIHDRDVLGGARRLADTFSGAVVAVTFTDCDGLGAAGADRVVRFGDATDPDNSHAIGYRLAALGTLIAQLDPRHIVLPDNDTDGGDTGRRLAALLGRCRRRRYRACSRTGSSAAAMAAVANSAGHRPAFC